MYLIQTYFIQKSTEKDWIAGIWYGSLDRVHTFTQEYHRIPNNMVHKLKITTATSSADIVRVVLIIKKK